MTDAIESAGAGSTLLAPVSIVYDQLPVHEVELMVSESRGGSKRPEDLKWLAEYARRLEARLGRIYLDFGTPVPVLEKLTSLGKEGLDDRQIVERVALEVCHRINRTTPVTATAAVCVAHCRPSFTSGRTRPRTRRDRHAVGDEPVPLIERDPTQPMRISLSGHEDITF